MSNYDNRPSGAKRGRYVAATDCATDLVLYGHPEAQRSRRAVLEAEMYERSKIADEMVRRIQSRELAGMVVHLEILRELQSAGMMSSEDSKGYPGCVARVTKLIEAHGLAKIEEDDGPEF